MGADHESCTCGSGLLCGFVFLFKIFLISSTFSYEFSNIQKSSTFSTMNSQVYVTHPFSMFIKHHLRIQIFVYGATMFLIPTPRNNHLKST